ncbi:hypothetical protein KOR42_18080 [Thalassoglobus neptunius]|uniref:Uncharacterized protein n=1 Tax=Thalassoglobus neptunius TaxID=1938619 RepID=A0A5C5X689_9PLAN|nr:hypothetical protein KOR42_18080 [Thalassoglobus neptunius]
MRHLVSPTNFTDVVIDESGVNCEKMRTRNTKKFLELVGVFCNRQYPLPHRELPNFSLGAKHESIGAREF